MEQIKADAQKELGPVFFRYTVQRDDSLSKIAQQFMGDRFKFYILAKYNDISNPSRLAAGTVVKVPGKAPPPVRRRVAVAAPTPGPRCRGGSARAAAASRRIRPAARPWRSCMARPGPAESRQSRRAPTMRSAKPRCAARATRRTPPSSAMARDRSSRVATSARPRRRSSARTSMSRSQSGDRVLALEPTNQKAKLERERAIDLRKKLNEKFGRVQNQREAGPNRGTYAARLRRHDLVPDQFARNASERPCAFRCSKNPRSAPIISTLRAPFGQRAHPTWTAFDARMRPPWLSTVRTRALLTGERSDL